MKRGRKSSAELSIVLFEARPPAPPPGLTDEQQEEWLAVTSRMPPNWFRREHYPLLAQYCRHVVRSRRLAQLLNTIERATEFSLSEYLAILASEEKQSRALTALARTMRLSQQSQYKAEAAARQTQQDHGAQRLWESQTQHEARLKAVGEAEE